MFHPTILAAHQFARTEQQTNPIDACTDAAQFHGVSIQDFAFFLCNMGIDTARLSCMC